jgi:hypothetical protein
MPRGQDGQTTVLATVMMLAVLGMAAVAIDVATWYQKHHQVQVSADAAVLAAANCLANSSATNTSSSSCTSINDPSAVTVAQSIASINGASLSATNISRGFDSVTVTLPATAPALLAGIDNIRTATTQATAKARYYPAGLKFSCPSSGLNTCLAFFAGNTYCPTSATNTSVGLVLVTSDSGGGNTMIPDAFTNGYLYDGANSASSAVGVTLPGNTTATCSTANTGAKGLEASYTSTSLPYPDAWPAPNLADCTKKAAYFSTQTGAPTQNQITSPGIYCVTGNGTISSSNPTGCQSSPTTQSTGYLYVDEASPALTSGGWYEFISPCTVLANSATPTITNVPDQPLIYGTANITIPATASALPTCTSAANNGTAGSDLYITGSSANVSAPLYDQCGTTDINQNNSYLGYVAAWNIIVEQNNSVTGNGPTSASGSGVVSLPASDQLGG